MCNDRTTDNATNANDLPETPEEQAACDAITPDLVHRLWEQSEGRPAMDEDEAQRIDALAKALAAADLSEPQATRENLRDVAHRCVNLRNSYADSQRRSVERGMRLMRENKTLTADLAACRELLNRVADAPLKLEICHQQLAAAREEVERLKGVKTKQPAEKAP